MSVFEEFSNSVKAQLYDRVSSPFLGAYVISWLLWNYKIVLIAVSDMKGYEKLSYIENNLTSWASCTNFNSLFSHWANCYFWVNLVLPFITALFYILVWPIINTKLMVAYKKHQNYHKAMQLKMDKQKPISYQEAIRVRKEAKTLRDDHESEIRHYKFQTEELLKEVARQIDEISNLKSDKNTLKSEIKSHTETIATLQDEQIVSNEKKQKIHELNERLAISIANIELNAELTYDDACILYEIHMKSTFHNPDKSARPSLKRLLDTQHITTNEDNLYRTTPKAVHYMQRLYELQKLDTVDVHVITPASKQSDIAPQP